jgi:hypothetical protein
MKTVVERQPRAALRELRKEPRHRTKGSVTIHTDRAEIQGQLVDMSENGFRMAHGDASLEPGQTLRFAHREAAGQARVVWNRIMSGRVETGFLIVERS